MWEVGDVALVEETLAKDPSLANTRSHCESSFTLLQFATWNRIPQNEHDWTAVMSTWIRRVYVKKHEHSLVLKCLNISILLLSITFPASFTTLRGLGNNRKLASIGTQELGEFTGIHKMRLEITSALQILTVSSSGRKIRRLS